VVVRGPSKVRLDGAVAVWVVVDAICSRRTKLWYTSTASLLLDMEAFWGTL